MGESRVLTMPTGLGLTVEVSRAGITRVWFGDIDLPSDHSEDNPALESAVSQLKEYFAGTRRTFDLPLNVGGTAFQRRVWEAVREIPFGETRTYLQIARAMGNPGAVRAVGAANGANPVPIVIPCHRVVATGGGLGGYGGGLDLKRWLLAHESAGSPRLFGAGV